MRLSLFDEVGAAVVYRIVKQIMENTGTSSYTRKESGGESAMARYIRRDYLSLAYFQAHPDYVTYYSQRDCPLPCAFAACSSAAAVAMS